MSLPFMRLPASLSPSSVDGGQFYHGTPVLKFYFRHIPAQDGNVPESLHCASNPVFHRVGLRSGASSR